MIKGIYLLDGIEHSTPSLCSLDRPSVFDSHRSEPRPIAHASQNKKYGNSHYYVNIHDDDATIKEDCLQVTNVNNATPLIIGKWLIVWS